MSRKLRFRRGIPMDLNFRLSGLAEEYIVLCNNRGFILKHPDLTEVRRDLFGVYLYDPNPRSTRDRYFEEGDW